MTQQEIDLIQFKIALIQLSTDHELYNPIRTKEQKQEMSEYKQNLRDIQLYNYEMPEPPEYFQMNPAYDFLIEMYKKEKNITE